MKHFYKETCMLHFWRELEKQRGHAITAGQFQAAWKVHEEEIARQIAALEAMLHRARNYRAQV